MDKKMIVIGLSFLISLTVFVSAQGQSIMTREGEYKHYTVELYLQEGWNIVAGTIPLNGILEDSEIRIGDIGAMWYYSPKQKKYLQVHPNVDDEGLQKDDDDFVLNSAMWIYSKKEGRIKYSTLEEYPRLGVRELIAGWNFVSITPDFVGNSLNEVRGSCDIEKAVGWELDGKNSEWDILLKEQFDDLIFEGGSIFEQGRGIVLKVSNDCNLGSSNDVVGPPGLPVGTTCTDPDGGLNYYIKAVTRDSENSVADYCDGDVLVEWICDEVGVEVEYYTCPNGCDDGVCLRDSNLYATPEEVYLDFKKSVDGKDFELFKKTIGGEALENYGSSSDSLGLWENQLSGLEYGRYELIEDSWVWGDSGEKVYVDMAHVILRDSGGQESEILTRKFGEGWLVVED